MPMQRFFTQYLSNARVRSILRRFELGEIYEFLFWFELGLIDHGIARRVEAPYHRVHRFLLEVRPT